MAVLFCDSGDHHAAAVTSGKWDLGSDFNPTSYSGQGRFGTNPVMWGWSARTMGKNLGGNYAELIAGVAMQFHGDGNFGEHNIPFLNFQDGSTTQISVYYDVSASQLNVYRGQAAALLSSISFTHSTSSFVYVEFRALIDNSAGEWELRVNGSVIGSGTGVDTQQGSNAYANVVRLGEPTNNSSHDAYYDDLYILDTGSGENVDFLGDVRVECLLPNGNGTTSELVGQDANSTDNYQNVDDATPDGDTTYNESGTADEKDTYNYGALTTTAGTVYAVQILPYAKKTDAGARSIKGIARESGGTEEDSAAFTLTTGYQYLEDVRELDPDGAVWTIASVNAAEFGAKVV